MDKIDKQILKTLQKDGRKKNNELAKEAGLAPSSMLERVKKLEEKKIITRYRAVMDPEKLGFNAQGFVCISLDRHQVDNIKQLEKGIRAIPNVRACYHVTGRFDYLLHLVASSLDDFGNIIKDKVATIPGMGKIETFFIYSEVKPDQGWPIDAAESIED